MNKKAQSTITFDTLSKEDINSGTGEFHASWNDAIYPRVLSGTPQAILDIGCGTGAFLARFSPLPDLILAGVDISSGMIQTAKERLGQRADLRTGDSEALPWPDASFDTITCIASFHHYPNPMMAFREIYRVLRPRGQVVLADILLPTPIRQAANALLPFIKTGDVHFYSRQEISAMARQAGFSTPEWNPISENGFWMVTKKL